MHQWLIGIVLVLISIPSVSHAAVIINEVAWMGSVASANDEWIELHNTEVSGVVLDGWILTDGANLVIELSGTIGGNAYAVLERTDDSSAPGSAFLIYTGALANTGATLTLTRDDGSIEDQVAGGENWGTAGGDNTSKATAQYTSSGWITATATPGSSNATESTETTEEAPVSSGSGRVVSAGTAKPVKLTLPNVELSLSIEAPRIAYVNESIDLAVTPSGIGKTFMDSLQYEWNFGDGITARGKKPTHTYAYPGEYVIVVYGSFVRHEQAVTHHITVLPTSFSVSRLPSGDVQIHNDAPYEVDVSHHRIIAEQTYTFPKRSVMLAKATITLPYAFVGAGQVTLRDQAGLVVASTYGSPMSTDPLAIRNSSGLMTGATRNTAVTDADFLFPSETPVSMSSASSSDDIQDEEVANVVVPVVRSGLPEGSVPYLGLVGIIVLGVVGLMSRTDRATLATSDEIEIR